jgi:hypothetical protein
MDVPAEIFMEWGLQRMDSYMQRLQQALFRNQMGQWASTYTHYTTTTTASWNWQGQSHGVAQQYQQMLQNQNQVSYSKALSQYQNMFQQTPIQSPPIQPVPPPQPIQTSKSLAGLFKSGLTKIAPKP